ncbi:hypothetical protein [Afipia felis]|uniref:Major tropism determinant N-terminal domain-containing protein n=2 Tax=Afipia felis TaxID=1035 RepID=A0A381AYN6_AFIFE|nr:hypothetical protein [Afipia felis]EKS26735.1 hypothetical protein HMPREF9697_03993 [Afipia felis ATCC 53690]SUU76176.1 Uncharacterised protein [Afipia felis]SUU84243.1 Uncharacterised protein [Afipia felis]SUW28265.1 Uncharacterised protein [Afipia felis]
MSIQRQLIRGNTATIEALTPLPAQVGFDTDKHELHVGDGVTQGAVRLAKKNIADSAAPAQITADTNDYNPANQKHARTLLLTTDAFHDVTGLVPTTVTDDIDGREITLYNNGANNFRLVDQSPASSAANRFDLGGASLTLAPKTSATLRYNKTALRWFLIAQTVGSSVGSGSVIAMTLAASSQGYSIINGTISTSVSGGALTVKIKTLAGNDPSALDPVLIKIRNNSLAAGGFTVYTLTAATSFVVSNGSSLGVSGAAVAFRLWLVAFDDGGTFRLGIVNCLLGASELPLLRTDTLASSTAEGGAGAADNSGVFYTGTAVASKSFEVLGYLDYPAGLAAAGTWSINPTTIQPYRNGIPLPAERLIDVSNGKIFTGRLPVADNAQMKWDLSGGTAKINPQPTLVGYALPAGTDFNSVLVTGLYGFVGGGTNANAPDGRVADYFSLQVLSWDGTAYLYQRATAVTGMRASYERTMQSGVWGAWRRIDRDDASVAKAWVSITGSTGAIVKSYNVSSVTRTATGRYTVNFTTAMADTSYVVAGCIHESAGLGVSFETQNSSLATTSVGVCVSAGASTRDGNCYVVIFD